MLLVDPCLVEGDARAVGLAHAFDVARPGDEFLDLGEGQHGDLSGHHLGDLLVGSLGVRVVLRLANVFERANGVY